MRAFIRSRSDVNTLISSSTPANKTAQSSGQGRRVNVMIKRQKGGDESTIEKTDRRRHAWTRASEMRPLQFRQSIRGAS